MDVTPKDGVTQPETQTQENVEQVAPTTSDVQETPEVAKAVIADTAREQRLIERFVKYMAEGNQILQTLGLTGEAVTADSTEVADTSKSADEAKSVIDVDAVVRKAVEETTAVYRAEIEELKSRIPETTGPGVLVQKSEQEEAAEVWAEVRASDPMTALKAALAAKRGEAFTR